MKVNISGKIFDKFPGAILGLVKVNKIDNTKKYPEITKLLRVAESRVRNIFETTEKIGSHPAVSSWRKAYRTFGSDPHEYRCSIEALLRRVVKGGEVPAINPLVDLYNYISLKYLMPVGGEDLNMVKGGIILDFATGSENFIRLGGTANEPPDAGEVIYRDEVGVMCRRWNWREADRTKLTNQTTEAIIVVEALPPVAKSEVEAATTEFCEILKNICGVSSTIFLLDASRPTIEL